MTRGSLRPDEDDDLLLPLDPSAALESVVTTPRTPPRRFVLLAAAGVVALMLINVVLGAPDSSDDAAPETAANDNPTSDEGRAPSDDRGAETTDTTAIDSSSGSSAAARGADFVNPEFASAPGRVDVPAVVDLARPVPGLSVLGHTRDRVLVRVNLSTGAVDELIEGDGWRFQSTAHQAETAAGFINLSGVFVIDADGTHHPTFDEEFDVTELWPAADGVGFWGRRRQPGTFVRYDHDGSTLFEAESLPAGTTFLGDTGSGFVVEAQDGTSFLYQPQTGESVALDGRVLATSPSLLVVNRCVDVGGCVVSAIDPADPSGDRVELPVDVTVAAGFDLAPDGRLLRVDVPGGIVLYDTALGGVVGAGLFKVDEGDVLSWSGGGHDLLRVAADGAWLRTDRDDEWVSNDLGGLGISVQPRPVLLGAAE